MKLTCELTSAAVFALLSTTVWAQTLTFSRTDYLTSDAPRGRNTVAPLASTTN